MSELRFPRGDPYSNFSSPGHSGMEMEYREMSDRLAVAQLRADNLEQENYELRRDNNDLKARLKHYGVECVEQYEAKLSEIHAVVKEIESERDDLSRELSRIRNQLHAVETKAIMEVDAELASKREHQGWIVKQALQNDEDRVDWHQRLRNSQAETAKARAEADIQRQKSLALMEQVGILEDEKKELEEKLVDRDRDVESSQSKWVKLQALYKRREGVLSDLQFQMTQWQTKHDEYSVHMNQLESENQRLRGEVQRLMRSLEERTSDMNTFASEVRTRFDSLQTKGIQSIEQARALEDTALIQIRQHREIAEKSDVKYEKVQRQYDILYGEHTKLHEDNKGLRESISQLDGFLSQLEGWFSAESSSITHNSSSGIGVTYPPPLTENGDSCMFEERRDRILKAIEVFMDERRHLLHRYDVHSTKLVQFFENVQMRVRRLSGEMERVAAENAEMRRGINMAMKPLGMSVDVAGNGTHRLLLHGQPLSLLTTLRHTESSTLRKLLHHFCFLLRRERGRAIKVRELARGVLQTVDGVTRVGVEEAVERELRGGRERERERDPLSSNAMRTLLAEIQELIRCVSESDSESSKQMGEMMEEMRNLILAAESTGATDTLSSFLSTRFTGASKPTAESLQSEILQLREALSKAEVRGSEMQRLVDVAEEETAKTHRQLSAEKEKRLSEVRRLETRIREMSHESRIQYEQLMEKNSEVGAIQRWKAGLDSHIHVLETKLQGSEEKRIRAEEERDSLWKEIVELWGTLQMRITDMEHSYGNFVLMFEGVRQEWKAQVDEQLELRDIIRRLSETLIRERQLSHSTLSALRSEFLSLEKSLQDRENSHSATTGSLHTLIQHLHTECSQSLVAMRSATGVWRGAPLPQTVARRGDSRSYDVSTILRRQSGETECEWIRRIFDERERLLLSYVHELMRSWRAAQRNVPSASSPSLPRSPAPSIPLSP